MRNIRDCSPGFDWEHGSWEEAEQMAGLKLTTIWFLLLWQFFLPRKVLEENSGAANGFGLKGKWNSVGFKALPHPCSYLELWKSCSIYVGPVSPS